MRDAIGIRGFSFYLFLLFNYFTSSNSRLFPINGMSSHEQDSVMEKSTVANLGLEQRSKMSGENEAKSVSCTVADDCSELSCRSASCISGSCEYKYEFSSDCRTVGYPKVLALRVIAQDIQTTNTKSELSNYIFGTNGKSFTMTSQFSACSYNMFNIDPYSGTTSTDVTVSDGTDEVEIPINASGEAAGVVVDMAIKAANEKFGDLESQFGFVMICLPPGTKIGTSTSWKAYAFVNSYQSIYNDKNCIYPSIQMHELGHNLGLSHSNDEENYGDRTGMMGLASSSLDGPVKCFNAPKSYQLGWYDADVYEVTHGGLEQDGFVELGSIAYYEDLDRDIGEFVMIRLVDGNNGYDYFVNYNAANGINSGTEEGANSILITKVPIGQYYVDSTLVTRLEEDIQSYAIVNFDDEVSIKVFGYNDAKGSRVFFYPRTTKHRVSDMCMQDRDCDDLSKCTSDYCNKEGVCELTKLNCDSCGAMVNVTTISNEFPLLLVWNIENVNEGRVARASSYNDKENTKIIDSECLEYGKYKFSIFYAKNSTPALSPAKYFLTLGEIRLDEGDLSEESYVETLFTICSKNSDCIDYDGCTVDFCNPSTNLCNNTVINDDLDCINCSWLLLNVTTDNFPEETTWNLNRRIEQELNIDTLHDYVISGDPYPIFAVGFGRSKANTKANGRSKANTRSNAKLQLRNELKSKASGISVLQNENNIYERICIEKGFLYQFSIKDSFGDGICCDEGIGEFYLNLGDKDILRGGNFGSYEEIFFILQDCNSDEDCYDDNFCTTDLCLKDISTCVYHKKPCSDCGFLLSLSVHSDDWHPQQNYLALFDVNRKKVAFTDGPYTGQDIVFNSSKCLEYGKYLFRFYDDEFENDGGRWSPEWNGYFSLYIDGHELLQDTSMGCAEPYVNIFDEASDLEKSFSLDTDEEFFGPDGIFGNDKVLNNSFLCHSGVFEILQPSSQPSISSSPSISFTPSFSPTTTPTEAYNWTFQFDKLLTSQDMEIPNEILLYLNVSKRKVADQVKGTILDEACMLPDMNHTIEIFNKNIAVRDEEKFDSAVLSLRFNESLVGKSGMWKSKSEGIGVLCFCVRSELLFAKDDVSISFIDTKVNLEFDFKTGFFEVNKIELTKADSHIYSDETVFTPTSCVCMKKMSENFECIDDAKLKQNEILGICIFPESGLQVSQFKSVYLYQDDIIMVKAVEDGVANKLTYTKSGNIGYLSTNLISALFLESSPSPLVVKGTVVLDFTATRSLSTEVDNYPDYKEASFQVEVDLKKNCFSYNVKSFDFTFSALLLVLGTTFIFFKWKQAKSIGEYERVNLL